MPKHKLEIGEQSGILFEKNINPCDDLAFIPRETWTQIVGSPEPSAKPPRREIPFLQSKKSRKIVDAGQLIEQLREIQNLETPENALEVAHIISERVGHTVTAADVINAGVSNCIEELLHFDSFQVVNFMEESGWASTATELQDEYELGEDMDPSELLSTTCSKSHEVIGSRKAVKLKNGGYLTNKARSKTTNTSPEKISRSPRHF
jgi:hypothetical protein